MSYKQQIDDAVQSVIDGVARDHFVKGIERGRAEERAEHAAQRDGKDALISHLTARVATLEGVLKTMLASAYPHPIEHPTMTEAWKVGREAMDARPAVSLNSIKAAAVREAAAGIMTQQMTGVLACFVHYLEERADRLEAGEGENAQ